MKMIRVLASAVAVLSLAGTIAMAQGAPNVKKACAADMQKLCPGIADPHAAHQCMRSHVADVSPDCHSAMEAAKAARAERKAQAAAAAAPAGGAPPAAGAPPASSAAAPPH
jgi:hypothetical protein